MLKICIDQKLKEEFQINYKECKLIFKSAASWIYISFRLTIRNVNYDKARIISKTKTGFRLTIRNVNYGEYHNITVKGFVLD